MEGLGGFARLIDRLNDAVGRSVAWLALTMVLTQFVVVVMRYVFGVGSVLIQESITYMHGFLFTVGAGYTLLHGGHVRVDVFYRDAAARTKAWVDLLGSMLLLLPVCLLVFWASLPYVRASWAVFEGSKETSGLHGIFLFKTAILVLAVLLALQGLALAVHSLRVLLGRERAATEQPEGRL